jgi:hypothetical protein
MKKTIVFAAAVLLFSAQAHAATCGQPILQGTWELGGGSRLNYNHNTVETGGDKVADYDSYGGNIDLAYYLWDNVALGAFFAFQGTEFDPAGRGDSVNSDSTLFGPELIWNFCAEERLWLPFNLYMKLGGGWADSEIGSYDGSGWGLLFDAGVKFFVNRSVSVNVYYEYGYRDMDNDTTFTGSGVGVGVSLYRVPY